jgi:hypothetical protein
VVDELTIAQIEEALGRLDSGAVSVRRAAGVAEALHAGRGDPRSTDDLSIVLVHQVSIDIKRHRAEAAVAVLARAITLRRERLAADDTPLARRLLVEALLLQLDLPARRQVGPAEPCAVLRDARATLAPIAALAASDADLRSLVEDLDLSAASRPRCRRRT